MHRLVSLSNVLISKLKTIDWLGPLALRLYLAPIFIAVGAHKFANFDSMVAWFGNAGWGLGLPMPRLMVFWLPALSYLAVLLYCWVWRYACWCCH